MSEVSICNHVYRSENITEHVREKMRTHMPIVECPDKVKKNEKFNIKIRIEGHPSRVDHYISNVDIYFIEDDRQFNPVKIARIELSPEYTFPEIVLTLSLKKSGHVRVVSYCTTHGLWEAGKRIVVEE